MHVTKGYSSEQVVG